MTIEVDRWAWAEVDHDALAGNVAVVADRAAGAEVWAVVKADGYGHGAVEVARTVLGSGASGLCVALTQEALELRAAGVTAGILLLSEQPVDHAPDIVANGLTPTVYREETIDALGEAADPSAPLEVHLKVDTGMQRVGVPPDRAGELAQRITATPSLRLGGVFTHLAVADSDDDHHRRFTRSQLDRFETALSAVRDVAPDAPIVVHTANSAATFAHPMARRAVVRAGIALYGISPGPGVDSLVEQLRPAMSLHARVSFVKTVAAGSRISYGLRHRFDRDTTVATLPIGYADGVPRRLGSVGGEVLIGGLRCPIVGVVTMDQLMVDVGEVAAHTGHPVSVGDPAVLIGSQGDESIRAEEWAERLDTIGYEIVCGVSRRVGRRHRPMTP